MTFLAKPGRRCTPKPRCLQILGFCNPDLEWGEDGYDHRCNTTPRPRPGRFRAAELRGRRGGRGAGAIPAGEGQLRVRGKTDPCSRLAESAGARRGLQTPRQGWGAAAATCSAPWRCGTMRGNGGDGGWGVGADALQRVLISFRSFCSSRRGNPLPSPRHAGTAPLRRAEFGVNLHLATLE